MLVLVLGLGISKMARVRLWNGYVVEGTVMLWKERLGLGTL